MMSHYLQENIQISQHDIQGLCDFLYKHHFLTFFHSHVPEILHLSPFSESSHHFPFGQLIFLYFSDRQRPQNPLQLSHLLLVPQSLIAHVSVPVWHFFYRSLSKHSLHNLLQILGDGVICILSVLFICLFVYFSLTIKL